MSFSGDYIVLSFFDAYKTQFLCRFFLQIDKTAVLHAIGANVWSISAPKMERASVFLHVASGNLKIASLETKQSGK